MFLVLEIHLLKNLAGEILKNGENDKIRKQSLKHLTIDGHGQLYLNGNNQLAVPSFVFKMLYDSDLARDLDLKENLPEKSELLKNLNRLGKSNFEINPLDTGISQKKIIEYLMVSRAKLKIPETLKEQSNAKQHDQILTVCCFPENRKTHFRVLGTISHIDFHDLKS